VGDGVRRNDVFGDERYCVVVVLIFLIVFAVGKWIDVFNALAGK
jgi:hypothetical protein